MNFKPIYDFTVEEQIIIRNLLKDEYFNPSESVAEPCGIHIRYPLAIYEDMENKVSIKTSFTQPINSRMCFLYSQKLYKLEKK